MVDVFKYLIIMQMANANEPVHKYFWLLSSAIKLLRIASISNIARLNNIEHGWIYLLETFLSPTLSQQTTQTQIMTA